MIHAAAAPIIDRKSTPLNSSHPSISYAVFCLKKKNPTIRLRAAALWPKAFAIALNLENVPDDLAQGGSIQRKRRRIYCGHRLRRFNPLANGSDAICGLLR